MKRARTATTAAAACAFASSEGRKLSLEDVTVCSPSLDGGGDLSLYAILDGHGGYICADWCAARLPALLSEGLVGIESSAAIKDATRVAFEKRDLEARC